MRSLVLLAALAASPAMAAAPPVSPIPASSSTESVPGPTPPMCALPPDTSPSVADPSAETPASAPVSAASTTKTAGSTPSLPLALAALPFARHVAASGASITDLGVSHGMREMAARSGDQFMVFQVTSDGEAAVSGAMTELTPTQLGSIAAGNITPLGVEHGLRGLFVRSGPRFQVFYTTPDGERVIPGVLWDAAGKDLTRPQVAGIPGAVPTVVVGDGGSPQPNTGSVAALPLVRKTSFGTIGPATVPRLWMFFDPQCIYSMRAYQMLEPYVAAGRLRVSLIPLSVLDYEDQGQSTKSALALLSKPADRIATAWRAGDEGNTPTPEAEGKLRDNMAIAQAIGLHGTPTFVWRKPDGSEGRIDGIPASVDALVSSIGRS